MERLKDARTIAAKRGVRSVAVTTDRRLIIAAIALLAIVTDSHNTKFTLRSHNEEEIQDPHRLGNCLCRLTRRTVPRKKAVCRWSRQPHRRRLPCGNRWWYQDSRLERKSRCC